MITPDVPRPRRLIRTRDLRGFRDALVDLTTAGAPVEARRRLVLVPTVAAGELLRQSIERQALGARRPALLLPDIVTRDGWLARLRDALPGAPPLLTPVERVVLFEAAAGEAARRPRLGGAPFTIRPGLVGAMVDLYDELRRRQRTVRRFARTLFDQLRVELGMDRGSEGLIHQTAFLGFAFLAYERAMARSGRIDEHALRQALLRGQPALTHTHLVVAVADHPADPRGLWPVDFDLIGRLTGLAQVDVVMTDETHDAGLRARLELELPGIEEARYDPAPDGAGPAGVAAAPVLVVPPADADGVTPLVRVSRDREEELRDVVRAILARARAGDAAAPVALVFHRPLPYLYLAGQVLRDARVPFEAFDALPLASEPYAALVDLLLAVVRTDGARDAVSALLRSSLVRVEVDGHAVDLDDVAALDAVLAERRASSGAATFPGEVAAWFGDRPRRRGIDRDRAARAAAAAAAVAAELTPCRTADRGSDQVRALAACLRRHERAPAADDPWIERHRRARAAVLGALDALADAFARHADAARSEEALVAAVRHVLEAQTFRPRRDHGGVQLVDAMAARFGTFDHTHLVGLVETDWPDRPRRTIFYTSGLLTALSWPDETDQTRAQQAAFRDLLGLARRTTTLHAFELEGDGLVAPSPLVEFARGLPVVTGAPDARPTFPDETLTRARAPEGLEPGVAAWLDLRRRRPPIVEPAYAGRVGPRAPETYRVSRVDRYVTCPFKYFAESVLGLDEERPEMAGLTPLERGTLLHEIFERFYRDWAAAGHGTITPATMPEALARFADLAHEALAHVPGPDRVLEETRLLGSLVGRGVAERVFELEADAGGQVADRLLEFELEGPFDFPKLGGLARRTVSVRGKADRIDVFANGALRVVDYKLGRAPDVKASVQIGVYAYCAEAHLTARDGRPHPVREAMYLAFGDDRHLEGRLGRASEPPTAEVLAAAERFARATEAIEAGEFPPRPLRAMECQYCGYAGVCRKEYPPAPEDDEAAEPV
ncbi:MAG: PD-(D/E)XK nuclease family protein [Vicinamibacterales bacterium]